MHNLCINSFRYTLYLWEISVDKKFTDRLWVKWTLSVSGPPTEFTSNNPQSLTASEWTLELSRKGWGKGESRPSESLPLEIEPRQLWSLWSWNYRRNLHCTVARGSKIAPQQHCCCNRYKLECFLACGEEFIYFIQTNPDLFLDTMGVRMIIRNQTVKICLKIYVKLVWIYSFRIFRYIFKNTVR